MLCYGFVFVLAAVCNSDERELFTKLDADFADDDPAASPATDRQRMTAANLMSVN